MGNKIRYGCIGAGIIAEKKTLQQYSQIDEVEMAAVCDIDIQKAMELAQKCNVKKAYKDYREMLREEKLDLVSVCVPNYLHMPVILEALKNGCHVHCEKPLAISVKEAEIIADAKNQYNKKVMVGFDKRFTPENQLIKKLTESNYFGEIYQARCGWRRRSGIPGRGSWFTNKKLSGGGALIDIGTHMLDLTLNFIGYPQPYSVSSATYSKFSSSKTRGWDAYKEDDNGIFDVEDMAVGFIRLENQTTIDFEVSWASNIEEESYYFELKGTKGGVNSTNGKLKMFSEMMGVCVDITPKINLKLKYVNESEHIVKCILEDLEPMSTIEQSVTLMRIIEAAYKSADESQEIKCI